MQTPVPPSPPFLESFLEVLFCQSVKHFLRFGLDLLNGIEPASFQFNFILGNRKKSQGAKSGEYGGWGDNSKFVFRQKRTAVWDGALSW